MATRADYVTKKDLEGLATKKVGTLASKTDLTELDTKL